MKLKEWAEKTGVKYLTAYRWFKDGKMPVKSYQTESGTIIVEDPEFSEQPMTTNVINNMNNDVMSIFLKKTVEFSKNNSTVEDFAAYIISNFNLQLPTTVDTTPKYSRVRPNPEEVQKHFQQFIKKGTKPVPHISDDSELIAKDDSLNEICDVSEIFSSLESKKGLGSAIKEYDKIFDGVINRDESEVINIEEELPFKPTDKEIKLASKTIERSRNKSTRKRKQ
jgi:hypothetical protein